MKKQQHILTLIIVLAVIGIAVVIASIIYDEKIRDNKKAVETISVPQIDNIEKEEPAKEEEKPEVSTNTESDYVGEEEKESQEQVEEEQKESKQTDDEKVIELAKKEWGNDDSVSFSIEEKKDNKIYVAVKNDATVIQWYEVNTNDWTISEY